MIHEQDMSQVSDSDLLKEDWYKVRISEVQETGDDGNILLSKTGNKPIVKLTLKIQNEGPYFGRTFNDQPSLEPNALFKLKAYYKAIGYTPGPEGHDPSKLVDGELWVWVSPGQYQGRPVLNIPPYSIRSIQEGPGGPGGQSPKR